MISTLNKAPIISALTYPYVFLFVDFFYDRYTANKESMNPNKSENK